MLVAKFPCLICFLSMVGYATGQVQYSVSAGVRTVVSNNVPKSTLSITSSLDDTCTCQLNGGTSFPCEDGDMLTPSCGSNRLLLTCTPTSFPSAVARTSLTYNVPCTATQRPTTPTRVRLRCSLSVRKCQATLKCTGGTNVRTMCRLDGGPSMNFPNAFSVAGETMKNLSCGDHSLVCKLQSVGSAVSTPVPAIDFTIQGPSPSALAISASVSATGSKAALALSSSQSIECTCMLNDGNVVECHNGAMFPNLLPGSHMLKLNCCSVEDKCGKRACIQRKLSWQLCPSSFRSRVTISGRNVTLSYAPHPRAMYKCSLYSRSSNELIREASPCPSPHSFPCLPAGQYYLVVMCTFPSAPRCDRNITLPNRITVRQTSTTLSSLRRVQVSVSGSKATLSLTTSGPTNCTCMLGDRDPIECQDGTMFNDLPMGSHVLKLNCCSLTEDKCGNRSRSCIQRNLTVENKQCPSDSFSGNVTLSGSAATLFFKQHPMAMYKCFLYNKASGGLVEFIDDCSSGQVFEDIFPGCYYLVVACIFPPFPFCNRNVTITDITVAEINFNCSTIKEGRKLNLTCSVQSRPPATRCFADIPGRKSKDLTMMKNVLFMREFMKRATISSLMVTCENECTNLKKTFTVI